MFARLVVAIVTIVTVITATAPSAQAQTPPERPKWEFLVSSGQLVPTGAQREVFDRGNLTAIQIGHVEGGIGRWARYSSLVDWSRP
jgi:hypothetical protein